MAKFRPSLFDTLIAGTRESSDTADANGGSLFPGVRLYSLDRMTESSYLDTLRRDLSWLLNTIHLAETLNLDNAPQVATSVVNFGIPDFSVRTVASVNVQEASTAIATAVRQFEPRIATKTLRVTGEKQGGDEDLPSLVFNIVCDVGRDADAIQTSFKTRIDVETNDAVLEQQR